MFLAGLTPIPYKVFTFAAGVFAINFGSSCSRPS
jgi:membrane protein YqaA with SNARE-associated domain